ncbi:hypothetical protein F5888DRAFT_1634279 [Russula emetica]|nr:hypothetical protein F5888DRAFT_1634279 [Russula emetica]
MAQMPAMTQKLPSTLATSREFFQRFGSRGSALTVVPFNEGSKQDVDVLVDYIYMALGLDISTMLSLPLPFPRLAARSTVSTGNDGRYSDCKISLETLINHWSFQSWGEHLCPVGVVIGLMDQSDMIAQEIETHGVTQVEPDWADLSVGFDCVNMNKKAELRRAIVREIIDGADAVHVLQTVNVAPRANFLFEFPELSGTHTLQSLSQLRDVIDLINWAMGIFAHAVGDEGEGPSDARGMPWNGVDDGYIKHLDGRLKDGTLHAGWVDAKIGDPVDDKDVRGKYEKAITCHADLPYIYTELDQRCQTHTYCYVYMCSVTFYPPPHPDPDLCH